MKLKTQTKNNRERVGYPFAHPRFVYFELFEGEHPSKKIYSIQQKDWLQFLNSLPYPGFEYAAWHIPSSLYKEQSGALDHLRVYPTNVLRQFMENRGITLPDAVYIQPRAYEIRTKDLQPETITVYPPLDDEWEEGYFDQVYDLVNFEFADGTPATTSSSSNKGKVLLAALVAAISLLK